MLIKVSHKFPVSAKTFWKSIFFNEEFNKKLYLEKIGTQAYETIVFEEKDETIYRKVRITPEQNPPGIIKKFIKGQFSYTEEGKFSAPDNLYEFKIIPSVVADKIDINGNVRVESEDDRVITRTIELNITAKIFGIGGQIERFLGEQIKKGYEQSYNFTLEWIKEKNLK